MSTSPFTESCGLERRELIWNDSVQSSSFPLLTARYRPSRRWVTVWASHEVHQMKRSFCMRVFISTSRPCAPQSRYRDITWWFPYFWTYFVNKVANGASLAFSGLCNVSSTSREWLYERVRSPGCVWVIRVVYTRCGCVVDLLCPLWSISVTLFSLL